VVLLLILLILERLCITWLKDKFSTDEKTIELFSQIEAKYSELKKQSEKKPEKGDNARKSKYLAGKDLIIEAPADKESESSYAFSSDAFEERPS